MLGVMKHYQNRGMRQRGINNPLHLNAPARWTYLNRSGSHPYVPHMTREQLYSARGGYLPCIDGQVRAEEQDHMDGQ